MGQSGKEYASGCKALPLSGVYIVSFPGDSYCLSSNFSLRDWLGLFFTLNVTVKSRANYLGELLRLNYITTKTPQC